MLWALDFLLGITAWYDNCPALDRKVLQKVVRMAIQDLYTRWF
jgi:hypothetical protein